MPNNGMTYDGVPIEDMTREALESAFVEVCRMLFEYLPDGFVAEGRFHAE